MTEPSGGCKIKPQVTEQQRSGFCGGQRLASPPLPPARPSSLLAARGPIPASDTSRSISISELGPMLWGWGMGRDTGSPTELVQSGFFSPPPEAGFPHTVLGLVLEKGGWGRGGKRSALVQSADEILFTEAHCKDPDVSLDLDFFEKFPPLNAPSSPQFDILP